MNNVAVYILIGVVAAGVGKYVWDWWFKKDEESEDRRRAYAGLSRILAAYGLKRIPTLLDDLAFVDISDFLANVYAVATLFQQSPEVVVKEFDDVFSNVLAVKLKDPAQIAWIEAKIAEAKAPVTHVDAAPAEAAAKANAVASSSKVS